jgi:hypothetical protein
MKKAIYATIAIFVGILIITGVIAERTPVREVKYENGQVLEK